MRQQFKLGKRAMRLALCATALGVSLASQSAHASVVSFTYATPLAIPFNLNGLYINLVTGATSSTTFAGYDVNLYFSGSATPNPLFRLLLPNTGGVVGAGTNVTPLAPGATVGPTSSFITGVTNANQAAGVYNFGISFVNEVTNVLDYGYFTIRQLANPPSAAAGVQLLGFSYENTGAAITLPGGPSVVPEPATWALVLTGLFAVGASTVARRRRAVPVAPRYTLA